MKHNAIIVTTWDGRKAKRIHKKAKKIFNGDFSTLVSDVAISQTNAYCSIFIAPDGSKEGWDTSNKGDKKRKEFIDYVRKEGAMFVEVEYANEMADDPTPKIINWGTVWQP